MTAPHYLIETAHPDHPHCYGCQVALETLEWIMASSPHVPRETEMYSIGLHWAKLTPITEKGTK